MVDGVLVDPGARGRGFGDAPFALLLLLLIGADSSMLPPTVHWRGNKDNKINQFE